MHRFPQRDVASIAAPRSSRPSTPTGLLRAA
jgi:hypothetical protein